MYRNTKKIEHYLGQKDLDFKASLLCYHGLDIEGGNKWIEIRRTPKVNTAYGPHNSYYCFKLEMTNQILRGYFSTSCDLNTFKCPTLVNFGLQNNNCTMPTAMGLNFFKTMMKQEKLNYEPIYTACLCNENTCNQASHVYSPRIFFVTFLTFCTMKIF